MSSDVFIKGHDDRVFYGLVWPDLPGTPYNETSYVSEYFVSNKNYFWKI